MSKNTREKILILGGTEEASALAQQLVDKGEADIITSLAGRTQEPKIVAGEMRIGGFGGIYAMTEYLQQSGITRIIDATHPYAEKISRNARFAANAAGVPLEVVSRPQWQHQDGDDWYICESLDSAAKGLPIHAGIFLALGSQHLAPFFHRDDARFVIRMVDAPRIHLPFRNKYIIVGMPANTVEEEVALFRQFNIRALVCRNSGGRRGYNKILAARECGITVYLIKRPDASQYPETPISH